MNIFYLDKDVTKCAKMHVDKHCVKMILEYAQLLSTTHRVLDGVLLTGISDKGRKSTSWILSDGRNDLLYKATHINHPSAIWVRKSDANYSWLFRMFGALMDEYTYRYGKTHASERLAGALCYRPKNIPKGEFTEPPLCMPDDCKVDSVIESYRNYYKTYKKHMFIWKNRVQPVWVDA